MRQRLEALCAEVDGRDDVDVMILTGVDPVFCAGADTKEIARLGASLPPTNPGAALRAVDKPVICAVNGPCVTGGLEVALSCDFIVASERATFADTHARLGVLPRWGLSALLPAAVGVRRAKEMTSTGRFVTASEALAVRPGQPGRRPRGAGRGRPRPSPRASAAPTNRRCGRPSGSTTAAPAPSWPSRSTPSSRSPPGGLSISRTSASGPASGRRNSTTESALADADCLSKSSFRRRVRSRPTRTADGPPRRPLRGSRRSTPRRAAARSRWRRCGTSLRRWNGSPLS